MARIGAAIFGLVLLAVVPCPASGEDEPQAPAAPASPTGYEGLFPFGARGFQKDPAKSLGGAGRLQAIESGVRWLVAHQTADGSWDPSALDWCDGAKGTQTLVGPGKAMYAVGVTGMALSAILGSGASEIGSDPASRSVAKGIAWLRGQQDGEGCLGPRPSGHFVYNHAFAMLALVEAFGASGDAATLEAARKALQFASLARNPEFAWRYGVQPGENDTSITGCMSLPFVAATLVNEAAEAAGQEGPFPIDESLYAGVRAWVEAMTDTVYGRLGYVLKGSGSARAADLVDAFPPEKTEATTAIGIMLRQRIPGGDPDHDAEMIRLGAALLSEIPPAWTPGSGPERGNIDLYYWYYGALAMHRLGGDAGDAWMRALVEALVRGQRGQGDPCGPKGSWDACDPWSRDGGRIYTTSMALLALETPSRFPRLAPGRPDLVEALEAKDLPEITQVQLLGAVATYRAGGAEKALIPFIRSKDAAVRKAGAVAMARAKPSPFGVQVLGSLLSDADTSVRRAAVHALRDLGPDAAPAVALVSAALKDADPGVREGAAAVLGASGAAAQASLDGVKALLSDPDGGVRVAAAGSTFRLSGDVAVVEGVLLDGVQSPESRTRAGAARALGLLGTASPRAASALKAALEDRSPPVVASAAASLWALHAAEPRLVSYVSRCLAAPEPEVRALALETLAAMGPDAAIAVPEIAKAAMSGARSQRELAVKALGAIGKPAVTAAPALYAARASRAPSLRAAADAALARLALPAADVVPVLAKGLESQDERWVRGSLAGFEVLGRAGTQALLLILERTDASDALRIRVVGALGRVGAEADSAVTSLARILDATDPNLRLEAVRALGGIGPRAAGALAALVRRLDDTDRRLPLAVVRAVARIATGSPEAVASLAQILDRKSKGKEAIRVAAAEALGGLGALALPAIGSLTATFTEEEAVVPDAAVQALGRIGKAAIDPLRDKLKILNGKVRGRAASALAAIGPDSRTALTELLVVFEDAMSGVQWQVGTALVAIGRPALRGLTTALRNRSPIVRAAAARTLGDFGREASSASSALKALLSDSDPGVALAANEALEKVKAK